MRILEKLGIKNWCDFKMLVHQFFKFGLVGVLNTAISLIVYYIFIWINSEWFVAGNTVGFVLSVLNAYFWNSRFVFVDKRVKQKTAVIKSFVAYGCTFLISTALLIIMVDYWGISKLIAPLINLLITIPFNFLLNKFWTFN